MRKKREDDPGALMNCLTLTEEGIKKQIELAKTEPELRKIVAKYFDDDSYYGFEEGLLTQKDEVVADQVAAELISGFYDNARVFILFLEKRAGLKNAPILSPHSVDKVIGNLNEVGKAKVVEFLKKHHKLPVEELTLQAFYDEINLGEKKHYEESQFNTRTGHPEVLDFDDEDFEVEELEE